MRDSSMLLVALLVAGPALAADTHPFSVHDMLAMDRISDPRVSPDGGSVAFTVRVTDLDGNRGRNDIWLTPATGGAAARRLTTHEASDTQGRWAPDGKSLFFISTRTGSAQVFRVGLDGGDPQPVTSLPLDVDALEVAPGGQHLLFAMAVFPGKTPAETAAALDAQSKRKASGRLYDRLFVRHWDTWENGTRNHLFSYEVATGKVVDLMSRMDADAPSKPFGGSEEYSVTPDGRTVVFTTKDVGHEEAWSTNFDLYAVPIDGSAAPRRITTNPATDTQPRFSPDGKTLAYLAMSRAGFEADRFRIVLRDWTTGAERPIDLRADASETGDRSPDDIRWSLDGQELYATADHLGHHPVFAIDPANAAARILAGDGHMTSPQPMPAGKVLYGRDTLLGPAELHVVHRVARMAPARITSLNDEKVAAARFGKPEPFTFTGSHCATVHGWITHPVDFDPAKKYPVAFLIHGGPQGSFGNNFHYRWNPQAYAGAGYAAVSVDFTGSTGYGQAFTDRIRNDWGGAPYEDLMKGLDYALGRYPFLDGDRVCALGASYGGYMINWIAGKTARFKCLVSHDGNLDEYSAYYMTEELWFPEWEHGGPAYDNPEGYTKHSPINLVKDWKTPTLVIHGEKDYRVVYTQGLATFTALQRKGIPSKLLVFPDENHWVLKPHNSILWHETVLGWLDQWVGSTRGDGPRSELLAPASSWEKVAGQLGFGEGPAWHPDGYLLFEDVTNNRTLKLDASGQVSVFRENTDGANGQAFDAQGRLIACEGNASGRGRRLVRVEKDGTLTVLAERYQGKRLNSPNDLAIDLRGRIYFTDPRYSKRENLELDREAVYRADPDGTLTRVADSLTRPNGILVSADGRTLYVADNASPGGAVQLWAFDLDPRGGASRGRILYDFGGGRGIDGMALDADGRIWATAGTKEKAGIYVFMPDAQRQTAKLVTVVPMSEDPTNCTFGGPGRDVLYVTTTSSLYRIRTAVRGRASPPGK